MSLMNLITISSQLGPLGGCKVVGFGNGWMLRSLQAHRARGGFECTLLGYEPSQECRVTDQHFAQAKDGEMKDLHPVTFLLLNYSASHSALIFKLRL